MNATEPSEACAAKDVSEDGFRLIVGGVGHGDSIELAIRNETLEEGVSRAAGRVFKVGALAFGLRGDVFVGNKKLQVELPGEFTNELFVAVGGFAAQLVVEVDHRKDNPQLLAQFEEKEKEGHGIGATGNSHADAGAGAR